MPAVRDLPLVVTVHDVAFLREPEAFTRRGLAFHRRGLEIAHREAAAIITASRFARDELIDVGFDRDRIHLAPHGVETRVPESATQMRRAARRARPRPPVRRRGRHHRAAQGPRHARAGTRRWRAGPSPTSSSPSSGPPGWLAVPGLDGPGIHRLGTVDERTLDAVYRNAVACAVPSRYEGFGLPGPRGDGARAAR